MSAGEFDFASFSHRNPCAGCPAPCCLLQLIPYRTPSTYMDIDFMHYMLLFPRTEMVVALNGDWYIVKWETCSEFEADSLTCKVHGTPQKPRTCAMYNPYNCWYKRSFVTEQPAEVYRLDLACFLVWVNELQFDEDGRIVSAPNFERSQEILAGMPIEPTFGLLSGESVASDPRLVATASA